MLSKRICKLCVKETDNDWDSIDEDSWDRAVVMCPTRYSDGCINTSKIRKPPPEFCPHKLEHAVAMGVKKARKRDRS